MSFWIFFFANLYIYTLDMYFYQSVFFLRIAIYSLCFARNLYRVKVDLLRPF